MILDTHFKHFIGARLHERGRIICLINRGESPNTQFLVNLEITAVSYLKFVDYLWDKFKITHLKLSQNKNPTLEIKF